MNSSDSARTTSSWASLHLSSGFLQHLGFRVWRLDQRLVFSGLKCLRTGRSVLPALLLLCAACAPRAEPVEESGAGTPISLALAVEIPPEFEAGQTLFEQTCALCHGSRAVGTSEGPPLIHIYYEPNHHGDAAFYLAVQQGVRAHHWRFGDMPAIPDVDFGQATEIIRYVRFLQDEGGIF